ncbi:TPA: hypothetical protein DEB29_03480 [Candidatus Wolfebacteria bacterium]|nr:hypothetical protein [Candidatus Wolfebacteria bacterium]
MSNVEWKGLRELNAAIKRNPQVVLDEGRLFLTRGLALYKSGIVNAPWRIGGRGGGAPVSNDPRYKRKAQRQRSGNLRDTHITEIDGLVGRIGPNMVTAPYAKYVHDGTRRMQGRPWLDFVKYQKEGAIEALYLKMLDNITADMAK